MLRETLYTHTHTMLVNSITVIMSYRIRLFFE